MTLEEKIRAIMEAKQEDAQLLSEESIEELEEGKETITTKGGTTITDEDDSDDDKEDDHQEPDADDEGGESDNDEDNKDDSDEDTEMSKDTGKKDKVDVKEGNDPFGSLDSNGGDSAADAGKNAKLKAKLNTGSKSAEGKLSMDAKASQQDDNGDNARLKAKQGNGDKTSGKLGGTPEAGDAENPDVARNTAGTELQKGAKVNEHMAALFNGEELSEEFQSKAATIFEAAVESVAQERVDALTEEYAQQVVAIKEEMEQELNEAVEEVKGELVEQIDGFLNYVVEQWIEDNQVALESGMKVEMVNSFIDGLKNLFKEHYVEMPEEKLDVVAEQAQEIESLEADASKLAEENEQLYSELVSLKSALVFESVADSLTDVQKEKFSELVENVEFTTDEEYTSKLETLKENYFPNGQTIETKQEQQEQKSDDIMSSYVQAVTQNLKFR